MAENEIIRIISNEKEWRRHILSEISEIKKNQIESSLRINTLETKHGMISGFVGAVSGFLGSLILKLFN